MTFDDACDRLPDYLAGELAPSDRVEFELCLAQDSELQKMLQFSQRLEGVLQGSEWLTPSADFTLRVMAEIATAPQETAITIPVWERVRTWLSLAALLPLLILYGRPAFHWTLLQLQYTGNYLDSLTGYTLFGLHPVVVLGLFAPLLAGGFATCVLSDRCRLSS
jgi:hypothetical protein